MSDGNNVGTPPPSPGFGKYKLAEHRYGREEMLALFNPDIDPPEEIKKLTPVYVEKKQQPLALVPLSEEEQVVSAFLHLYFQMKLSFSYRTLSCRSFFTL